MSDVLSLALAADAALVAGNKPLAFERIRKIVDLIRGFDPEKLKSILDFLRTGFGKFKEIYDIVAPIFGWPPLPSFPLGNVSALDATTESVIEEVRAQVEAEPQAQAVDWATVWEIVKLILSLARSARPA